MTHAIELAQRIEDTQALTQYAAHRLAVKSHRAEATISDIVILSSKPVIESEIAAANAPGEAASPGQQRESPP